MSTPSTAPHSYRFGLFEVFPESGELLRQGRRIKIQEQPFRLLVALLERPGEIVSREVICRRLWAVDTFVEFEQSLGTAITKLRRALDDDADNPRFVETIPKRGYRFIASLREPVTPQLPQSLELPLAVSSAHQEAPALPDSPPVCKAPDSPIALPSSPRKAVDPVPSPKPRTLRWTVALAIAILLVVALPKLLVLSSPTLRPLSVHALTSTSRIEVFGGLQTDGARLFFLERKGHKWNLMQMPASGGEPQPFPSPFENTKIFAVSSDASEMIVAPFARRDPLLPLYLIPSVGGSPRRIAETFASDATFTPDGRQIAFATPDGIYLIQRDGMNLRKLVSLLGRKYDLDWAPDGHVLRFTLGDLDGDLTKDHSELWEVDFAGSQPHPILPGWDERPMQCCGKWIRDGRYYTFVSLNHGGAANVWILGKQDGPFPLKRTEPTVLSSGPIVFDQLLPARDGHHLFTLGFQGRDEYVAFNPQTRQYQTLLGGLAAAWLGFSRDQNWTVSKHADGALWKSKPDGSDAVQLVSASLHPSMPRLSPDGAEVVFQADADNSHVSHLYVIPATGGQPRLLISGGVSVEVPEWAPDRSEVVYTSTDPSSGRSSLYVLDRKSGEKKLLRGSEGFRNTRWSPDGKYLAAVTEDDSQIAVFDLIAQHYAYIAKGKVFSAPIWSRDSQSLFFQDILEDGEPIHQVFRNGHPFNSFHPCGMLLNGNVLRCGFEDLASDGSLVLHLTRGDHDIYSLDLNLP